MKTITTILMIFTLVSCGKNKVNDNKVNDTKYEFYHADTNEKLITHSEIINAMQKDKVFRLDIKNNECTKYSNKSK